MIKVSGDRYLRTKIILSILAFFIVSVDAANYLAAGVYVWWVVLMAAAVIWVNTTRRLVKRYRTLRRIQKLAASRRLRDQKLTASRKQRSTPEPAMKINDARIVYKITNLDNHNKGEK